MRRYLPLLIIVVGLLAAYLDIPGAKGPIISDIGAGPFQPLETKLGLDLKGGYEIVYQAQPRNGVKPTQDQLDIIKRIMEERVNSTGVSEPIVETEGTDRIRVQLPGVNNAEEIAQRVGKTGDLEFVPLPKNDYGDVNTAGTYKAVEQQKLPTNPPPLFSGAEVNAGQTTVGRDPNTNTITVNFVLSDKASKLFSDYTGAHVNEYFAITLDGVVQSAPYIKQQITGGNVQISGSFTFDDAQALVNLLKYGALPFAIQPLTSNNIPASLGAEFLAQTLLAAAIGIGLVLLFMLIYYRLPGVIADFALIYYSLVVLAIFRMVPVTLTLAGIAGFVLSVGMAVDANILIFERTKEELRVGKTLPAAIEAGFNRAWNSIFDSNISSLITATILYVFGSATIRGFALVLIIGVLTSMFTAITVSRTLLRVVVQQEWARKARFFGVTEQEFQGRAVTRRAPRTEVPSRV